MKKITKRLGAAFACLCLLSAALPATAFAADVTGSAATMSVTYTASGGYIITIPESLNLNEAGVATFECTNNTLDPDKTIRLSVDFANTAESDGNLYLVNSDGSDKIRYELGTFYDDAITANNPQIAAWHGGSTSPIDDLNSLRFTLKGIALTADTYSDVVYFSITTD